MLTSISGRLAASSWLLLSAITAMGFTRGGSGNVTVNVSMAAVFGLVGGFLLWRTRATATLHRPHPADLVVETVLRTQLIANLAMALLGLAFASAAALRVWREAVPVIG
ncbi:hypothetical protein [Salipiger bermudensis]|uniref:hypothetical protein n=1 Tax=Salipiger bermudensis TaxID=344736 RepID=UPI003009C350